MKALQFRMNVPKIAITRALGLFSHRAYTGAVAPVRLEESPDATVRGERWVVLQPALTGICGSDQKQVLLKGHFDNPIASLISFPHVLGHESAGTIAEVGKAVTRVRPGDRVVLNPWLSCEPRGITPVCAACAAGSRRGRCSRTSARPGHFWSRSTGRAGYCAAAVPVSSSPWAGTRACRRCWRHGGDASTSSCTSRTRCPASRPGWLPVVQC